METGALAVGATGLGLLLETRLDVLGVLPVELTILVELELPFDISPVFLGDIIETTTLRTLERDHLDVPFFRFCHDKNSPM